MDDAAANGHLEVVQWLNSNRKEGCSIRAMNHAALNGHLHVVKWLHETNVGACTNNAMDNAAKNGHLEIVKFLHYNRKEGCRCVCVCGCVGRVSVFFVRQHRARELADQRKRRPSFRSKKRNAL